METPLNASSKPAGALFGTNRFLVPPYQREYAWELDEVQDFLQDLRSGLSEGSYFLGLVILTDEGSIKHVVDGQQRMLTLTLLANAIYHEAVRVGRKALAERIRSDFLTALDYDTDEVHPRVQLSDSRDNETLQHIIEHGAPDDDADDDTDTVSGRIVEAWELIARSLQAELAADPFKRLGIWADFVSNQLYFAVFVHPDPASAYRVFEVINTRGRELTTADLLKNYILSQTPAQDRDERYREWKAIARPLSPQDSSSSLVPFIRHVVTLRAGHVLPKELFAYLADRRRGHTQRPRPPSADELMASLQGQLPLYLQMIDPTVGGPAEPEWLGVFSALNDLNVITVRPLLLAIAGTSDPTPGMHAVLRLVVRRIVVGNLGTGNIERRFAEAARSVAASGAWREPLESLSDLNPESSEFFEQLRKRSFNKATLTFMHRSIQQQTTSPEAVGTVHPIRPRQASQWDEFPDDDFAYWGSTLGNSILTRTSRRPKGAATWSGFKATLLPEALVLRTDADFLSNESDWSTDAVEQRGRLLADAAIDIWY